MITTILFDFSGVIGTDGYKQWEQDLGKISDEGQAMRQQINNEIDKGKISIDEFIKRTASALGVVPHTVKDEIIHRIVINMELVRLIKILKYKYKIGLLSNYHHEWLEPIIDQYKLRSLFDSIYISSRFGLIKPEEAAFRKALGLIGAKPDEAIFVDDRHIHVEAANRLGIHGILYETTEILKKDLNALGIRLT